MNPVFWFWILALLAGLWFSLGGSFRDIGDAFMEIFQKPKDAMKEDKEDKEDE